MANHNPDPTGRRQQEVSATLHNDNAWMVLLGGLQGSNAPCGLVRKEDKVREQGTKYSMP